MGTVVAVIASFLTLATIAVLVSQRAHTGQVISTAGQALSGVISAAVAPVAGGSAGTGG